MEEAHEIEEPRVSRSKSYAQQLSDDVLANARSTSADVLEFAKYK